LHKLFYILLDGKWIIFSVTAFISIAGVIYSLLLPNIYESKALIIPNDSDNISSSLQGYAGLASLAGVRLPSGGVKNNHAQAMKKIKSLSFFKNNVLPKIFLPDLMALESWESNTNTLIYDESKYNQSSNKWVVNKKGSNKSPSTQESFDAFLSLLSTSTDIKTGFITISIKHQSPYIAREWVDLLIDEVNIFYRQKDKFESEKTVSFLNDQIAKTGFSEVKTVISELLKEETQKLALIEANDFYVFDIIDPPAVMERKSEPRRARICIVIALLGGMLSIITVFIRYYFFKERADQSL
jgi:capsular polysaccharide biosynthesis protein